MKHDEDFLTINVDQLTASVDANGELYDGKKLNTICNSICSVIESLTGTKCTYVENWTQKRVIFGSKQRSFKLVLPPKNEGEYVMDALTDLISTRLTLSDEFYAIYRDSARAKLSNFIDKISSPDELKQIRHLTEKRMNLKVNSVCVHIDETQFVVSQLTKISTIFRDQETHTARGVVIGHFLDGIHEFCLKTEKGNRIHLHYEPELQEIISAAEGKRVALRYNKSWESGNKLNAHLKEIKIEGKYSIPQRLLAENLANDDTTKEEKIKTDPN